MIVATIRFSTNTEGEHILYGLCLINLQQWRDRAGTFPRLYESGVVYEREPRGQDLWQSYAELIGHGSGDCEDLVSARVGELLWLAERGLPGGDAQAYPSMIYTGPGVRHVRVRRGDGSIEDPSKRLGM